MTCCIPGMPCSIKLRLRNSYSGNMRRLGTCQTKPYLTYYAGRSLPSFNVHASKIVAVGLFRMPHTREIKAQVAYLAIYYSYAV
jgi:hypothetical protein